MTATKKMQQEETYMTGQRQHQQQQQEKEEDELHQQYQVRLEQQQQQQEEEYHYLKQQQLEQQQQQERYYYETTPKRRCITQKSSSSRYGTWNTIGSSSSSKDSSSLVRFLSLRLLLSSLAFVIAATTKMATSSTKTTTLFARAFSIKPSPLLTTTTTYRRRISSTTTDVDGRQRCDAMSNRFGGSSRTAMAFTHAQSQPRHRSLTRRYVSTTPTSMTTTTTTTSSSSASAASSLRNNAAVDLKHVEFSNMGGVSTQLPPVLLLHGLLGNKRNFATVGQSLSGQLDRPRQVFGLDLRNHGENHHDWRDDMNYESMARDVFAFMDKHAIEKSVFVGHSMGGKVAQAAALIDPDRVDGLVVLDIAPVQYTYEEPHWRAVHDIIQALRMVPVDQKLNSKQVDQILRQNVPDQAVRAFCLTNWDPTTGKWKIHLDAIVSQLEVLAGFDVHNDITGGDVAQYQGDTFFIHGGQSRFVRHAYLPTISKYFPNHLLTTIKGAGHWIHAEAPDDTTALLKKYLDR